MKKILGLLLIMGLMVSFGGCGGDKDSPTGPSEEITEGPQGQPIIDMERSSGDSAGANPARQGQGAAGGAQGVQGVRQSPPGQTRRRGGSAR